jgi:hypothetical protein
MKRFGLVLCIIILMAMPNAAHAQCAPGQCGGGGGLPGGGGGGGRNNTPTPTVQAVDPITLPLSDPRFKPTITSTELLRAVTVGNPPRRPTYYPILPPNLMMDRPPEIPDTYPTGLNDGEKFIHP